MATLLRKSFPATLKGIDADQGIVEAFVSVFGVIDHAKERVMPGFFRESLQKKLPKGVWMHDWSSPVAKTLSAEEIPAGDSRLPDPIRRYGGLLVRGQFNLETQRGREAFSDIKGRYVDEFSFGYLVEKSRWNPQDDCTELLKGEIFEWSPVLVGCNPATLLVGVKKMPEVKGQYLGEYAESAATMRAILSAWESLCYGPLSDAVWGDDEATMDERETTIAGALTEFSDLCSRIFRGIMTSSDDEKAAQQAALKTLWPRAAADTDGPESGLSHSRAEAAASAVTAGIEEARLHLNARATQRRPLSRADQERLAALKGLLGEWITEVGKLQAVGKDIPAILQRARLNELRRKARQRAPLLPRGD